MEVLPELKVVPDSPQCVSPVVSSVTTNAGDSRPVTRTYGDGSVDCPYCSNPIVYPKTLCENPWCVAHPQMTVQAIEKVRAETDSAEKEKQERERLEQWRQEYHEEGRAKLITWQDETIEIAKSRGSCTHPKCLWPKYGGGLIETPRYVRHRKGCPRSSPR